MITDAIGLATYLQDAARLRRLMQPWIDDRRFTEKGGIVVYSVDTDVVKLYMNPSEKSVPNESRSTGYAQVFSDDRKELSIALGWALGEYIFYDTTYSQLPPLVIPPHEEELGRVFGAMVRDVGKDSNQAQQENQNLKKFTSELETLRDNETALLDKLVELAPKLVEVIHGKSGPMLEVRQFRKLLSGSRLISLNRIVEMNQVYPLDPLLKRALSPLTGIDKFLILEFKNAWEDRLPKRPENIDDAKVMARLEWINNKLKQTKFRFVHITGDRSLLKAAEGYQLEDGGTFTASYLRHPAAFLGAALNRGSKELKNDLLSMLDVFLGRAGLNGLQENDLLDGILKKTKEELALDIQPVLKAHPYLLLEFKDKWTKYTDNIVADHAWQYQAASGIDSSLINIGKFGSVISKIHDALDQKIEQAWHEVFLMVTRTGFDIIAFNNSEDRPRPRNPPPLILSPLSQYYGIYEEAPFITI